MFPSLSAYYNRILSLASICSKTYLIIRLPDTLSPKYYNRNVDNLINVFKQPNVTKESCIELLVNKELTFEMLGITLRVYSMVLPKGVVCSVVAYIPRLS